MVREKDEEIRRLQSRIFQLERERKVKDVVTRK
jgi:hypothetical protein